MVSMLTSVDLCASQEKSVISAILNISKNNSYTLHLYLNLTIFNNVTCGDVPMKSH